MSVNLLDLAKGYLTDAVVEKAASFLGESTEATQSGLSHIMPALLGGLMDKAGTQSGASDVLGLISKPELEGNFLDNIGGLFEGSNSGLMNIGSTLLTSILGGKLTSVIDVVTNAVGIKSGNVASLLKMAAPLLMGIINKKVGNSGISGLLGLLGGQKEHLEKAAPAGFLDKLVGALGVGSLGNLTANFANIGGSGVADSASNIAESVEETVKEAVEENEEPKGKKGGSFLPLVTILTALALTALGVKECMNKKGTPEVIDNVTNTIEDGTDKAMDLVKDGADAVKDGANAVGGAIVEGADAIYNVGADLVGKTVKGFEYLGEFVSRKLSNGVELIIPSKGFEAQLIDFIEGDKEVSKDADAWFNLRRVLFKTGSADLDDKSMSQIENVANILKAYPNIHLKLGGYTDNTGDATFNKTLSGKRANAVMQALIAKGIDASRLTAEGYGVEHPIASNDTEEGRALNRRVAARVSKK